jgi:hypothetical protein
MATLNTVLAMASRRFALREPLQVLQPIEAPAADPNDLWPSMLYRPHRQSLRLTAEVRCRIVPRHPAVGQYANSHSFDWLVDHVDLRKRKNLSPKTDTNSRCEAGQYVSLVPETNPDGGRRTQMTEREKKRGGRPAQGPKSGKGATLATRITAETRAAIEAEAERTGRSISQVAELWIEEARKGHGQYLDRLGGDPVLAAAIEKLVEIGRAVRDREPDPALWRVMVLAAYRAALPKLIPPTVTPQLLAAALDASTLSDLCVQAVKVIEQAPDEDPVKVRALQAFEPRSSLNGALFRLGALGSLPTKSLVNMLVDWSGRFPDQSLVDALEELRRAGSTAAAEIDKALEHARISVWAESQWLEKEAEAARRGEAIAAAFLGARV